MQNKQTLKIAQAHSQDIVEITPSFSSYVDEDFFTHKMGEGEDKEANSFPVKVVALEIGWLLREKEGLQFL